MGCGESDSGACVATGPCRPEKRIALQTEICSRRSPSQSLAGGGVRTLRQRERTSVASSRRSRGVATRSRVVWPRPFKGPPGLWLVF
jgi:hypothetical protein